MEFVDVLAVHAAATPEKPAGRVVHVTTFSDLRKDGDKVQELYERLAEARRQAGEPSVPFNRFVDLVRQQVTQLRKTGSPEVAFRVTVKDGKVNLTVRALKGMPKGGD